MLINATYSEETRVGIVDGSKLIDIDIETVGREQRKSNIYKGIITRIEPSLEACFVDYGEDRHGFLPFKEVSRQYFQPGVEVASATIAEALKEGQEIVCQVEKEERGNKGAVLTTFISLAGRYLVLMPNNPRGGGVSRRIAGEERQELRDTMNRLKLPAGMSIITRTAAIGRTQEELQWDLDYLLNLWSAISDAATPRYEEIVKENGRNVTHYVTEPTANGKKLKRANPAPFLIVEESSLVIRAIRDYFQPDIAEILVDTPEIYDQCRQFMGHIMPDMVDRVKFYRDETPLFSRFQIEHQIETAYARTVQLPSGGSIVIDHTEALVAIDVNSARSTKGSDIEETALQTNLEAAEEVARQMRLRDLGGLIVIDFIDMDEVRNQRSIEQKMREEIRPDRARVQVGRISRFGLLELSRQRLRPSLSEGSHITCPRCNGVGVIRDTESCALQILRILQEEIVKEATGALYAQVPVDVATYLMNEKRSEVQRIEYRSRVPILIIPNTSLETPHYHIERLLADDKRLEDAKPSFDRAEELTPIVDDPYALKSDKEKPQRPRQVPVIKSTMPRGVAPVHEEQDKKSAETSAPTKSPAAQMAANAAQHASSLLGTVFNKLAWFFGAKSHEEENEQVAAAKPKTQVALDGTEQKSSADRARNARRRTKDRREERADRPTRMERQDRRSGSRSERVKTRRVSVPAGDESSVVSAQVAQSAPQEPQKKDRPASRARAEKPPREELSERTKAPQPAAGVPEHENGVSMEIPNDAPENDQEAVMEMDNRRRRPRRRRRPVRVEEPVTTMADSSMSVVASEKSEDGQSESVAPANESVSESVQTQERPRRTRARRRPERRSAKSDEEQTLQSSSSEIVAVAPIAQSVEEKVVQQRTSADSIPAAAPETEDKRQESTQDAVVVQDQKPEVQPAKEEPVVQAEGQALSEPPATALRASVEKPEQEETAVVSSTVEPIEAHLEERLAQAGLTQVHTDPANKIELHYEPVINPGRPRPVLPPLEDEVLIQVHTDPKYLKKEEPQAATSVATEESEKPQTTPEEKSDK